MYIMFVELFVAQLPFLLTSKCFSRNISVVLFVFVNVCRLLGKPTISEMIILVRMYRPRPYISSKHKF